MYERYFGFSRPLFADSLAQDEAVFRTDATECLMQDLGTALARKDSVVILSGESGTGKTTIALDCLKELNTRLAFAAISNPPSNSQELLEQLLTEFSCEPALQTRAECLQTWRQFLSEMTATATRVCLLVECAENLETDVLFSLQNLTAADASLSPGANIVLTTTHPADSLLTSPELLALNQRVRLRRRIWPLSETQTQEYLDFKCQLGGVDTNQVMATDAAETIHELSGGILRVIDSLLESALISAAAIGHPRVTADLIATVAETQFGISRLDPAAIVPLLETAGPSDPKGAFEPTDIPTLTECVIDSEADEPARSMIRA